MRKPKAQTTTRELTKLHTYTAARLGADPATRDLGAPLQAVHDKLVAAEAGHALHDQMVQAAMALRDAEDETSDELLGRLYHDLRGIEPGRSLGTLGRQLLPKGLAAVTHCPVRDQPGEMRILAGRVAAAADSRIAGYAQAVEEKAAALDEKLVDYEAALERLGVAYGDLLRARLDWIRVYEKTYGELVTRLGKAKAEKFFKKAARKRKPRPAA